MSFITGCLVGLGVGTALGMFVTSLLVAARRGDLQGFHPTHQHIKGGLYRLICLAHVEVTYPKDIVAIYEGRDGVIWSRPVAEFDRRFIPLGENHGDTEAASAS